MFIGKYKLDNEVYFAIYYGCEGWREWHRDTFSPTCEDIEVLELRLHGNTYQEKKKNLRCLAVDWQLDFGQYSWSYAELAQVSDFFYTNGRRYGLIKEFKENGIL